MRKILFTLLLCLFSSLALATDDQKEVVVMGIGNTEDIAKQQAYRSAIQSVIGSMVVSETIVQNENLVQDKILSHSDGYVVKATQIGKTRQIGNGLLEVTMRVTVKSEQLKAKLKAENITLSSIDGQSIIAENITQAQKKQDAASILQNKLKLLPASLLMAEADTKNIKQTDLGGGNIQLTIPIKLYVNMNNYRIFADDLKKTLDKLGYKGKSVSAKVNRWRDSYRTEIDFGDLIYAHTGKIPIYERNKYNLLSVIDLINPKNSRCVSYLVPKDVAMAFQRTGSIVVKVEFLDASQNIILTHEWINSRENRGKWYKRHGVAPGIMPKFNESVLSAVQSSGSNNLNSAACLIPSPMHFGHLRDVTFLYPNEFNFSMTFDITDEELKKMTTIKCTVINTKRKE